MNIQDIRKFGKCNICGEERELSSDHVPPKSCLTLKKVNVESLVSQLIGDNVAFKNYKLKNKFQNGVQYDTICRECNSKLGKHYDKTLGKFVNDLTNKFNSNITPPPEITIKTKPFRLIKGVLGHSLSASLNYQEGK